MIEKIEKIFRNYRIESITQDQQCDFISPELKIHMFAESVTSLDASIINKELNEFVDLGLVIGYEVDYFNNYEYNTNSSNTNYIGVGIHLSINTNSQLLKSVEKIKKFNL